ncbi:MAG TPA: alkaline phosphatase family protein [Thermoanaerobaculia bacterium]|nr:alkaline phosphatase family protein [Thermoanaerobaculia bacterium]
MTPGHDLDGVRSELRRLGYLDRGFERFLLQDALKPRQPARALLALIAKVGLLAGLALAAALSLALAVANGSLTASPLDLVALFIHLFPPLALSTGLAFLVLCGVILVVIRFAHVRRIETLSLVVALAAGAGVLALALRLGREVLSEGRLEQVAVLVLATPPVVYLLIKLVYQGLLSLAIRFTEEAPLGRLFSRRWLGLGIVLAIALLTLPAVVLARRVPAAAPATLPTGPGERVVLVGIDGVLPEEIDYLLTLGELPEMSRLARNGRVLSYRRKPEPPASFWTAVATGVPGPDHGVTALDSFLPRGCRTPLAKNGPLRAWWSRVEVPLGLAEYRPVLANRRRAFAVWELASRGGDPALAVNWWATYPAEPIPGLVVAHGAYQLLREKAAGAVEPKTAQAEVAALASAMSAPSANGRDPRLMAALPPDVAAGVLDRAVVPDRFYREVFARRLTAGAAAAPRAAAVYLPGLDIAAAGWRGGDVAFADLVRAELAATDRLLAGALDGVGTVVLVLDPGRRREGGEGRILLWRRAGCAGARAAGTSVVAPEAVAAALLRALGLPQSAELPPPPPGCRWEPPPVVVAGYGEPHRGTPQGPESEEYLRSLRSLGYL